MGDVEVKTIKRVNRDNRVSVLACLVNLQGLALSETGSGGRLLRIKTEMLYINTFLFQCQKI